MDSEIQMGNDSVELPESTKKEIQVVLRRSMALSMIGMLGLFIIVFSLLRPLMQLIDATSKHHTNWWMVGVFVLVGLVITVVALVFAARFEKEAEALAGNKKALFEYRMLILRPVEPDYDEEFKAHLPTEQRLFLWLVMVPGAMTCLFRVWLMSGFLVEYSNRTFTIITFGNVALFFLSLPVMFYGSYRFQRFIGLRWEDVLAASALGFLSSFLIGLLAWPLYLRWRARTKVRKYREQVEWKEKPELSRELYELFHGAKNIED